MTDLDKLIADLEAATEGSEALDLRIAIAIGQPAQCEAEGQFGGYQILPSFQRFTRSVDAALTLLPKGYGWQGEFPTPSGDAGFRSMRPGTAADGEDMEGGTVVNRLARAATPALALCIAALRARAAA